MSSETAERNLGIARLGRSVFDRAAVRITALLLLLTLAAIYESFHLSALTSGDIWRHLRTGLWIFQNHAFPRDGLFSQYADRAWVDSSWLFEILAAGAWKLMGLKALPALLMFFKLALAAVTFLLARGWSGNFWSAVLLSAVAQYVIVDLHPLPIVFSILFFGVELFLLLQSRRRGDVRPLFWLPLLFFLWANLDGQFLDGLVLLGIFVASETTEFLLHSSGVSSFPAPAKSLAKISAIAGISVGATFLTPYSFHLFPSALQTSYSKVLFENFQEMGALGFRRPQHFVLLLLVMAAFFAIGRQRSRDVFKISVLGIFILLAFRVQRDVWCVVLPAIAVIADGLASCPKETEPQRTSQEWKWEKPLVAAFVVLVLLAAVVRLPSNTTLMAHAGRMFPVEACDFIRTNQLPGPLFNTYSWGGFLIWYLPEYPVAIDGRLNLYGDEINDRYFKVTSGTQLFETDPDFTRARTILLERNAPMTKALTTLPVLQAQFRVVYQDDLAIVLVRQ
jgi:hypothetical protein